MFFFKGMFDDFCEFFFSAICMGKINLGGKMVWHLFPLVIRIAKNSWYFAPNSYLQRIIVCFFLGKINHDFGRVFFLSWALV